MMVFVVVYKHRYGADLSAYDSEELANQAAAKICTRFVNERVYGRSPVSAYESVAACVKRLYDEGKYAECLDAYLAIDDDESLDVEALELQLYVRQDVGAIKGAKP